MYSLASECETDQLGVKKEIAIFEERKSPIKVSAAHSDPVIAASLYRNLRPFSGIHAVSYSGWMHRGSVDMWLGVLAARMRRYEDSEKHFGDAMRMDVRLGSRPFLAYDRLHCGEMMLRRGIKGDLERGAKLLRDASSDAVEMNMPALLDRAEGSLDSA